MQHEVPAQQDESADARDIHLRFKDEAERDRFRAICPATDSSGLWMRKGHELATEKYVAVVLRGDWGLDAETIVRNIDKVGRAGEKSLREDHWSIDVAWCYFVGFTSPLMIAAETFLAQVGFVAQTEGAKAGLDSALKLIGAATLRPEIRPHLQTAVTQTAALALPLARQAGLPAGGAAQFQAAYVDAAQSLLGAFERDAGPSLSAPLASPATGRRRPLRPEDFGALPTPRG